MWFKKKTNAQAANTISGNPKTRFEWEASRRKPEEREFIEEAVEKLFHVPLSAWFRGTHERQPFPSLVGFNARTSNGAGVFVGECVTAHQHYKAYGLYIDGTQVAEYSHDGDRGIYEGYFGVVALYMNIEKAITERERPETEAKEAEALRKKQEQQDAEAKKRADLLRKL